MTRILVLAGAASLLAGCMGDGGRIEGITSGAGNAIAANTVMQMVDPWQRGVEDTDLDVPAETSRPAAADEAATEDKSSDK